MEKDFEKGLAQKLNQRTIEPSANTWERVNLQRSKAKKKAYPIIYWIAATLIIGIGLTFLHFATGGPDQQNAVVNKAVPLRHVAPTGHEVANCNDADNNISTEITKPVAAKSPAFIIKTEIAQDRPQETSLSQQAADINRTVKEQKAQEILVALEQIAKAGKQPTEDDVDALIAKARLDIAAGNYPSRPTDAAALLKTSESELDESFRSGIFENLFKQKRIRVALSSH